AFPGLWEGETTMTHAEEQTTMLPPITDQEAAPPVENGPGSLANGRHGPRPPLPKPDSRVRSFSLLGVAVLASLPIGYTVWSTSAARQGPEKKEAEEKKDGKPAPEQKEDKKGGQPAPKADGGAKGLTMPGPAGLHIALDSPAAILSRAKELGLDDKQRQELE